MCTGKRACVCLHAYVLQTVLSLCPCVLAHVSLYARLYLCLHTCVWLYDVCASICTFVYACVCIGRRLVTDPYGSGRLQDAAAGDPYVCILRPMGPRVLTYAAAGIHMEPDGSIWIRSKGIHMDPVEGDPYGFL